jgi:hypothetical protein
MGDEPAEEVEPGLHRRRLGVRVDGGLSGPPTRGKGRAETLPLTTPPTRSPNPQ